MSLAPGYVYMMSNRHRTVLYIGVTSDLRRCYVEHRDHALPNSFTAGYYCEDLIYFECFDDIRDAIARETQLKKWSRSKKDALIARMNPERKNPEKACWQKNGRSHRPRSCVVCWRAWE